MINGGKDLSVMGFFWSTEIKQTFILCLLPNIEPVAFEYLNTGLCLTLNYYQFLEHFYMYMKGNKG